MLILTFGLSHLAQADAMITLTDGSMLPAAPTAALAAAGYLAGYMYVSWPALDL